MKEIIERVNLSHIAIIAFCGACMVISALKSDASTVATLGTGLIGFLGGVAMSGKGDSHE